MRLRHMRHLVNNTKYKIENTENFEGSYLNVSLRKCLFLYILSFMRPRLCMPRWVIPSVIPGMESDCILCCK